jgi:hypothetical protein
MPRSNEVIPKLYVMVAVVLAVLAFLAVGPALAAAQADDNEPPVVFNGKATPGSLPYQGGTVTISVDATDDVGVASVGATMYGSDGGFQSVQLIYTGGTSYSATVALGPNYTDSSVNYSLEIMAMDAEDGSTLEFFNGVDIDAQPQFDELPAVSDPSVAPRSLPAAGGVVTIQATATDNRGISDVYARVTAPGGGTTDVPLEGISSSRFEGTYTAPANTGLTSSQYAISITATDDIGQQDSIDAGNVTVATNQAPVVRALPSGRFSYAITEGDSLTLDASETSDPDGDSLTYAWDLDGDNEFDDATGATLTLSAYDLEGIMFADGKNLADGPANTSIAVQVYDQHNPPVVGYASVDVSNATPSGTVTGDTTVAEGSTATLGIENATDAGPLDLGSLRFFFDTDGDGVPNASGEVYGDALYTPSVDYVPDDNGTLHLTAGVVDKGESAARYTHDVTVTNVAPTATLAADGPVVEGSDAHVTFSDAFDPSNADTGSGFHYAYDVDGDGAWDIGDGTYSGGTDDPAATVPTDDDGAITVRAAIIDKDDGVTIKTVDVIATNATPALAVTGPDTTPIDAALTFTLVATDPSSADATGMFSYTIDWGDGQDETVIGPADATATHTYAAAGDYSVSVVATDKDGGASPARTLAVTIPPRPATTTTSSEGDTTTATTATTVTSTTATPEAPAKAAPVAGASSPPIVQVLSASVAPRCLRASAAPTRSIKLRYRLSGAAQLRVGLKRVKGSAGARVCRPARSAKQDVSTPGSRSAVAALRPALLAKGQKLSPGTYLLSLSTLDSTGKVQFTKHARFWVLKG